MGRGTRLGIATADERRFSERRAGSFSRRIAQEQFDSFVRANLWRVLVVAAGCVAAAAGIGAISSSLGGGRWFLSGAFVGVTWTLLFHWCLIASGAAQATMGDVAEQWTSTEFRRLRRRGWRIVDHVLLGRRGDVDHVAIGPDGVVVVETKWRSSEVDVDNPKWLDEMAGRLLDKTRQVKGVLQLHHSDVPVTSLIVFWGPRVLQQHDDTELVSTARGEVRLIAGEHLRAVIDDLGEQRIDPEEVARLHTKLVKGLDARDAHEAERGGPRRQTMAEVANGLFEGALGAFGGAWFALVGVGLGWWSIAVFAGLLAVGAVVRRSRRLRAGMTGWCVGVVATVPLIAIVATVDRVAT